MSKYIIPDPFLNDPGAPQESLPEEFRARLKALSPKKKKRVRTNTQLWQSRLKEPSLARSEFIRVLIREGETRWVGGISQVIDAPDMDQAEYAPKPGVFFTPTCFDPDKVPKKGTKDHKTGKGFKMAAVVAMPIAMAEIDDYSLAEQLILVALLIEEGMPEPSAIIFSGGKSLHLFWRLDNPYISHEVRKWRRNQMVLGKLLGGDESINDPTRRMRLATGPEGTRQMGPFWRNGPVRVQPILHIREDEVGRNEFEKWLDGFAHLLDHQEADPKSKNKKTRGGGAHGRQGNRIGSLNRIYEDLQAKFPLVFSSVTHGGKVAARCFNHDDSTASGFLSCTRDGRRYFTCPQVCQTTWFHDADAGLSDVPFDPDFGMEAGVTLTFSNPKEEKDIHCDTSTSLWTDAYLNEDGYLDERALPSARALVLRVPLGKGKTECAAQRAAAVAKRDNSVIAVAPLRTLVVGLQGRLAEKGCPSVHYSEAEGELQPPVTVCFPSIPRVATFKIHDDGVLEHSNFSLVIWDEVEASLRGLMGHLDGRQGSRAYSAMLDIASQMTESLLLDGYAGACTRLFLRHAGLANQCRWIQPPRAPKYEWVFHPRRSNLDADLLAGLLAGYRIGIACASANHALALGALLASETGKKVGVISPRVGLTVNTDEGEPEIDRVGLFNRNGTFDLTSSAACSLADLGWVDDLDVLLITWAAGTGVDIKGTWDRVAYIGSTVEHTVYHVRQMLGRWRMVRSNTAHVFAHRGPRPASWEIAPKWVLEQWDEQRETYSKIRLIGDVDPEIKDITAKRYREMCAVVVAADRAEGAGWLRQALEADAHDAEEPFTEAGVPPYPSKTEKALSKALKVWKDIHTTAQASELIKAPTLNLDALDELRDRGPSSVREAKVLRMQSLRDFYGSDYIATLDAAELEELVKRDRKEKPRKHLRRLGVALALRNRHRHQIIAAYDEADLRREHLRPDRLQSRLTRGALLFRYFKEAGIDLDTVEDGTEVSDEMCEAGLTFLRKSKRLHQYAKEIEVPRPRRQTVGEAQKLMGASLRRVGMTKSRRQRRVNGKRVSTYQIGGAARARAEVACYLYGLLHPQVGSPARDAAVIAFQDWLEENFHLLGI